MKRRTRLGLILGAALVVVVVLLVGHFTVRRRVMNYLLARYPSENFSIQYVNYGILPRRATAVARTASDKMPFEVEGTFQGLSLNMTMHDNYYVSRSEHYYRETLDPLIEAYGDRVYDYELTIREDMAPVRAGTRPIYPFELHIVLGESVTEPAAYIEHVSALASEISRQNIEGMEILHFISLPVRPDQATLAPYGLDLGLMRLAPEDEAATEDTTASEETEGTDEPSSSETTGPTPSPTPRPRQFRVTRDMMYEIFLDADDRPFDPAIIQNGFRLVPVRRQDLLNMGLKALPEAEHEASTTHVP